MIGRYDMQDLLNLISNEGAERLILQGWQAANYLSARRGECGRGTTCYPRECPQSFIRVSRRQSRFASWTLAATFTLSTLLPRQGSLELLRRSSMKTRAWRFAISQHR